MIHSLDDQELSLFSYEVLGLVGQIGAGPHDLRQMVRRGRILDWAGESQYYTEPKRLARLGYLEARKELGKTRERTVYTLTEKGYEALRAWAMTPARFTPLKSEPLLACSSPISLESRHAHENRRPATRHRRPLQPPPGKRGNRHDAATGASTDDRLWIPAPPARTS